MNLDRFCEAHKTDYEKALLEIQNGYKKTHWMWYIFPQIYGLGFSETACYYAIKNIEEAKAYLEHPILSNHLLEICEALLQLDSNDALEIMGYPDNLKLCSSMTLFSALKKYEIFDQVLEKFFDGKKDEKTIEILKKQQEQCK